MTSPMTEEERAVSFKDKLTRSEREFWDAAFCAVLTGMCAKHGDTQSNELAMAICRALADAALSARRARMKET